MKSSKNIFLSLILIILFSFNSFCQLDSMRFYCKKVILGMSVEKTDSLFPDIIGKNYKLGGFIRTMLSDIQQLEINYPNNLGENFQLRFLFDGSGLFYFDCMKNSYKKPIHVLSNSKVIVKHLRDFNTQQETKCTFETILVSFDTKVDGLEPRLNSFFSTASANDKSRLISYAKSICPEYSAAAIIRICELERKKKFLNTVEKKQLKNIANNGIVIHFMIGDMYQAQPLTTYYEMNKKLLVLN